MKKLTTFFKKDPSDLGRVINEVNPENAWVFTHGVPTRKYDGTACAIIDRELYKRYDSKINRKTGKRKPVPEGAIPCQEPDEKSGHWPHWVKCDRNNPADKYHFEALENGGGGYSDGTYELCGPKINGNRENKAFHMLERHGGGALLSIKDFSYESIREYLSVMDIEGIVFHHKDDDRMCKIRKSDFGIKR